MNDILNKGIEDLELSMRVNERSRHAWVVKQ